MPSPHPPALTPGYRSSLLRAPARPPVALQAEDGGLPFAPLGALDHDLLRNAAQPGGRPIGERLLVHGFVRDTGGRPLPGVLIELWQANAGGRYRHPRDGYEATPLDPNFGGAGRTLTDRDGRYHFMTVKPGPYPWRNGPDAGWRPAHLHFSLIGPRWGRRLVTQMYFEGDPLIAACPIVATLPTDEGRRALIAQQDPDAFVAHDHRAYRFDLVLK
ncbi:MAG: protocatechuate 3,4-dioxygenase subunit beta [Burkholderiales bacterium]|jgi:protocatechuate 3,4-dioxygenase beta subunit|nr:protocatechuate 3,4-dioxygenase subunit beta [Burkholderiales bacterium]